MESSLRGRFKIGNSAQTVPNGFQDRLSLPSKEGLKMGREVTPDAKNMKPLTWLLAIAMVLLPVAGLSSAQNKVTKYVRYAHEGKVSYGRLEGSLIHELNGNFLASAQGTGITVRLSDVRLLPPTEPSKVIAVGLNYRSHAGMSGADAPGLFAKLPSSLVGHEAPIVIPSDSDNLHYEGEHRHEAR